VTNLLWQRRFNFQLPLSTGGLQARTDMNGLYVFPRAPPGGCSLWSSAVDAEPKRTPKKTEDELPENPDADPSGAPRS
jgi:hypothetical protein